MKYPIIWFLKAYRLLVSPLYGQVCRWHPSCSAYALEAVTRHGAVRGCWLTVRRLGRCHPWSPGGVDLVPPVSGRTAATPTPLVGTAETLPTSTAEPAPSRDAGVKSGLR